MLKLTIKPGEYLLIGNEIKLVFAGGSANNMRILVDAPKSMNIVRSATLEKYMAEHEPGNQVHHYKDKELSTEAKEKIRAIIMEDRRKSGKIYHAGTAAAGKSAYGTSTAASGRRGSGTHTVPSGRRIVSAEAAAEV